MLQPVKPVDIIVPVYGSFHDARAAIESVLSSENLTDFRLVVIDDAYPERLADFIGDLIDHPKVLFHRNAANLGFSATVNYGMAMHPDRDIVLLNSDAVVYGDWLDRLCKVLSDDAAVATITPMSNAATILSYPLECVDYDKPLESSWRDIDDICAGIDADPVVIPTAIGFCMMIRRACLEQIGPFDAARFGRGYGEENDFCMRALARGWKNVAACNVFAWHRGASSFKGDRETLSSRAQELLAELHPHYAKLVGDFRRRDPLAPLRAEMDAQRVRRASNGTLIVGEAGNVGSQGDPAICLRPDGRKRWRFAFATGEPLPNLRALSSDEPVASLRQQLIRLNIRRVVLPEKNRAPDNLAAAIRSLGSAIAQA